MNTVSRCMKAVPSCEAYIDEINTGPASYLLFNFAFEDFIWMFGDV